MAPPTPRNMVSNLLRKRDPDDIECYSYYVNCDNNYGVRYGIIALIFISLAALLFISYFHAQRRIRKNLPPLAYHRWLVSRRQRYGPYPQQNPHNYYNPNDPNQQQQQQGGYPMYPMYPMNGAQGQQPGPDGFQPPPPAYGNWEPPPPMYQPPQGASKTMANQNVQGVTMAAEGGAGAAGQSSNALPMNGAAAARP